MLSYTLAFHWLECTCSHVQGHFLAFYATCIYLLQHTLCKVQACRGGCHTALDTAVHGLIGNQVRCLSLAVEIWRDRQFAYGIQDFRPGGIPSPLEIHQVRGTAGLTLSGGSKHNVLARQLDGKMQRTFLPFLQIAYHAMPLAVCTRGKVLLILYRRSRFE